MRRSKNFLKPVLKNVLLFAIIIGIFYGLYKIVINLDEFVIKKTIIKGGNSINKEKISKKFKGKNIFKIDINQIKMEIKDRKVVQNVKIKRELPNKLIIEIIEREPIAMIQKDNKLVMVDEEGAFFGKNVNKNYPLLNSKDKLEKKLKLLKQYNRIKFKSENASLEKVMMINKYDLGLIFQNKGNKYVLNVGRNQFRQKLLCLNEVFEHVKNSTNKIDLRFLPYVIYKDGGG